MKTIFSVFLELVKGTDFFTEIVTGYNRSRPAGISAGRFGVGSDARRWARVDMAADRILDGPAGSPTFTGHDEHDKMSRNMSSPNSVQILNF
jgi:hypothetical protein